MLCHHEFRYDISSFGMNIVFQNLEISKMKLEWNWNILFRFSKFQIFQIYANPKFWKIRYFKQK